MQKIFGTSASSDSKDSVIYDLGQIEATSKANAVDYNATANVINMEDFKNTASNDAGQALRYTPGVFMMPSATSSTVFIRGYEAERIGIFMDGIPMHDTYDRNTNFMQFFTFGISEISVSKGYTSPAYGANTLGGAINMVSKKPTKDLEIGVAYQFTANNENRINASFGRNLGNSYYMLTYSHLQRDSLNLSDDYGNLGPVNLSRTYIKSNQLTGKYGYQPNENHEYSLNFLYQNLTSSSWAHYDRSSFYLLGNSAFSDLLSLNSKLYYYTNMNIGTSATADKHDDYTIGLLETLKLDFSSNQNLKVGINLKDDRHRRTEVSNGTTYPRRDYEVLNSSLFAEYALRINDIFRVAFNGSYDRSDGLNIKLQATRGAGNPMLPNKKVSFEGYTAQGILYATLGEHTLLHANIGRKSNIPRMSEVYGLSESASASNVPNPNLQPESAINYELGADFTWVSAQMGVSGYYNDINNMLMYLRVDSSLCESPAGQAPTQYCYQRANARDGQSYGVEAYIKKNFFDDIFQVTLNYSWTQRATKQYPRGNTGQQPQRLTTYPSQSLNAQFLFMPKKEFDISANVSFQASYWQYLYDRTTDTYNYYLKPPTYFIDIRANYLFTENLLLSLGAYNLFDINYVYGSSNYAMGGRRVFASIEYRF